ncbi:MAG TPA: LLM class flavin-dependent oxidoreductase [Pseudonocardiaceae bacterium]|jgi:alkanesulfonate monooxygenase SsuD/methylene tetrahydromethanopterin reductase-like flavin-dependent oxidoreductase (luciferase family)|nr:LLM class flavin-dependent oxidoreductase [Pseudonocardiaceae bacterium]
MTNSGVGYLILTSTPPEQIAEISRKVEQLGLDELWVAEDYFCYGGFTAAEKALAATSRIRVGLGVVSSVARHPAVTAMETANIARSYPGRFRLGIGHGLPFWTDQMGLTPKSPLTCLRECVTAVGELLRGEPVDREGTYFSFRSIQLAHSTAEPVDLLTGVVGPRSLELSGEIADGTIMSVLAGPEYLTSARGSIETGMAKAGRSTHQVPTFAICGVSEDRDAARASVRPTLAMYIDALTTRSPLITCTGFADEVQQLLTEGGAELLAQAMPDEWIDEFAVAGDPSDVVSGIERLRKAGASEVVLTFNPATAEQELELVSTSVLPQLAAR